MRSKILIVLLFSLWGGLAQESRLFDDATTAYNEGDYEKAIDNYLKILESGQHSSELYYNLGNSYYKINKIAPSIYYFEKALLLAPHDPEINTNLGYAQNMTIDVIEKLPETAMRKFYTQVTGWLTFDQWAYTAVFFVVFFVMAYIVFYYLRYATQKRVAFITSLACALAAVVAVVLAYLRHTDFKNENPAIVFAEEVVITSEPNERSEEVFTLHEGTKVNIVEELNNWQRIQIADGKTGWLPKDSIKALKDF
ncbi:tetratricopeptide repeat protein [Arenibacter sp. GZD96]|uniref:tetratricopeptide repeat protein n=1 Tax=Aurantibrevibacter litoralis TaxID=3106030 RepID=UPI002AFE55C9|nr:tetratricopeptide repeat protein [Arenibacter sp. GZD-96]MEA1785691.1 tetratricopeptide repeat protein [Arenibacter sp. GZD-96]